MQLLARRDKWPRLVQNDAELVQVTGVPWTGELSVFNPSSITHVDFDL